MRAIFSDSKAKNGLVKRVRGGSPARCAWRQAAPFAIDIHRIIDGGGQRNTAGKFFGSSSQFSFSCSCAPRCPRSSARHIVFVVVYFSTATAPPPALTQRSSHLGNRRKHPTTNHYYMVASRQELMRRSNVPTRDLFLARHAAITVPPSSRNHRRRASIQLIASLPP